MPGMLASHVSSFLAHMFTGVGDYLELHSRGEPGMFRSQALFPGLGSRLLESRLGFPVGFLFLGATLLNPLLRRTQCF